MRLRRIMLIRDSSERDLSAAPEVGSETSINFSFGIRPSDGKPWPYEIDVKLKAGNSDTDSDAVSDVWYTHEMTFAAQYETTVDLGPNSGPALETAWPYIRPYVIENMRLYELQTDDVPLNVELREPAAAE